MKRQSLALLFAVLIVVPSIAEIRTLVRLDGWIVDSYCGAKNANPESTDDTIACVKKGAKLVLVTADGTSYELENQELALKHLGREVHVFGLVDKNRNLRVGNYVSDEALRGSGEPSSEGLTGRKLTAKERKELEEAEKAEEAKRKAEPTGASEPTKKDD